MQTGRLNDQKCRLKESELTLCAQQLRALERLLTELQLSWFKNRNYMEISWQNTFFFFFMIILIFFFLSVFFTAPACQGNLLRQPRREFQVCPVTEADTEEVRWMDKVKEETRRPGAAVPKPGIKHALFAPPGASTLNCTVSLSPLAPFYSTAPFHCDTVSPTASLELILISPQAVTHCIGLKCPRIF